MRYEQLEKLLMQAAADGGFADELRRVGSAARLRYLLDDEEEELLSILQRDGGLALETILRVVHAASANAVLRTLDFTQPRE